ncbi:TolB family protein [Emticicia agri]|uniref:WD40-like Beta Propeller Repeat n=1 Tax=Emticicia agri TaxID=2492393 RepID=A0A4Q5M4U9_9BACT|nr:PD40 domain-containing protein [Emticicia agri]RYU97418.1 hypothetical protein EWM59_01640 [Emticicia agri]
MKGTYFVLILAVIGCISCTTNQKSIVNIPYPQPFPDSTARTFLPGIVSKEGIDFNSAFSPDGKSYYFTRSENRRWTIYVTHYDGKGWSEPVVAPFSQDKYSVADPAFAPDGKLYFISNRPKTVKDTLSDFDIWYVKPLSEGQWSAPENLAVVNSDSVEYYMSFASNGNMYLGSARAGGLGMEDIYISRYVNGQYTKPENLGPAINSVYSDHDPCISPGEDFMIFKSENRPDGYGEADLYGSQLGKDKKWLRGVNMGKPFNTNTYEYCAYLTPDLKYFFFSSERNVKWISADFLKKRIGELCKE